MLAALIEQQLHTTEEDENGFNMNVVLHSCGTPCCIGGFCASLLLRDLKQVDFSTAAAKAIRQFLGCTREESHWLFFGVFSERPPAEITPVEAAEAIRSLTRKHKSVKRPPMTQIDWYHGVLHAEFWTIYEGWRLTVRKCAFGWWWKIARNDERESGSADDRFAAQAAAIAAVNAKK